MFSSLIFKTIKIEMYRIIILPAVLYGCDTWSLILREENRLTVWMLYTPYITFIIRSLIGAIFREGRNPLGYLSNSVTSCVRSGALNGGSMKTGNYKLSVFGNRPLRKIFRRK